MRKTIVTAGASGYIGSNVMEQLKEEYDIIALSRSTKNKEDEAHISWQCDLFLYVVGLRDTLSMRLLHAFRCILDIYTTFSNKEIVKISFKWDDYVRESLLVFQKIPLGEYSNQ